MRKPIIWFTLFCFVTTQTSALADPHSEGVAAGQAVNPVARSGVNTSGASGVVPGYTTTPTQTSYYRQPNLSAQGNARLALCATTPNDPVCQAQTGAMASANTPRPTVSASDPSVAAAQGIVRSPSSVLASLASYYSGCTTATTTVPAGMQTRSCLRYPSGEVYSCGRTLSVDIQRSVNCTPGDWIAHAGYAQTGIDVQCVPDRPTAAQRFRVTQDGSPVAFFDVDVGTTAVFPQMVAVLSTSTSMMTGQLVRNGVWVVDQSCSGGSCSLTLMIASDLGEICTGGGESGYSCTSAEPFLKHYAACRAGTQSGDNIQNSVCDGESGCTTTALDVGKCYAPSSVWTPYPGNDVTGTVAGNFWTVDTERAIVGWEPNPAYGPIPTMLLNFTLPRTSYTATDHWDDQCATLASGGRCTASAASVCVDGPSTKVIDGVEITRACWQYQTAMSCSTGTPGNACAALVAQGCTAAGSMCRRTNALGVCEVYEDSYSCPTAAQTVTSGSNCPSNVFCFQGNCFDISHVNDADFGRSMSMLEAAREAGVYIDTDRMQVFNGEDNRCRNRLLKNCCYSDGAGAGMTNQSLFGTGSRLVYDVLMNSENREFLYQGMSALLLGGGFSGTFTNYGITVAVNGAALPAGSVALYAGDSVVVAFDPWSLVIAIIIYIIMSMMSCNEDEGKLAMKEGAGLCHTIGTWCSSCFRLLGHCVSCIEHTTSKCCFNSMLARIVNEQGRAQMGKVWGSPEGPDCSGFSVAQLQALNFSAMDFSEFYASLVPTLPNVNNLQSQSAGQVPNCYYGQGRCQ